MKRKYEIWMRPEKEDSNFPGVSCLKMGRIRIISHNFATYNNLFHYKTSEDGEFEPCWFMNDRTLEQLVQDMHDYDKRCGQHAAVKIGEYYE